MKAATGLYRLLGDEARLRMLRVLSLEHLNVTELTAVLGLAQSGVSRHLGLLRKAGLVQESREGGFVYYTAGRDVVMSYAASLIGVTLDPVEAGKLFPIEMKSNPN